MKQTLSQRAANALYPKPAPPPDNRSDREKSRDYHMALMGIRRKLPQPPGPINPYARGAASPLGGTAQPQRRPTR